MNEEEARVVQSRIDEEQFPGSGYPQGAGMPSADYSAASSNLLMWSLDSLDIIEALKHSLMGEEPEINEKSGEIMWVIKEGKSMMNTKGVNKIMFVIEPLLGKNLAIADIQEKDAHAITKRLCQSIASMLYENSEEWAIDETQYYTFVIWLDSIIFLALTRIKNGGIKNVIKPTLKRVETYAPEQKKKSLLGFFRK